MYYMRHMCAAHKKKKKNEGDGLQIEIQILVDTCARLRKTVGRQENILRTRRLRPRLRFRLAGLFPSTPRNAHLSVRPILAICVYL